MWFLLDSFLKQINEPVALDAEARAELSAASAPLGSLSVSKGTAYIPIEGILTEKRDMFAAFVGGGNTTYPAIVNAIQKANELSSVKQIVLSVGYSPGGSVNGMFAAMDAIRESGKPVRAEVRNGALSAAYGLVSQAGEIVAAGPWTQFGSVGTAYDTRVNGDSVSITNTDSPKKRPDIKTDEGKEVIREQLDEIHGLFAGAIASARGVDIETVNRTYGQGSMVLADRALQAGMITAIEKTKKSEEKKIMDLEKLKAEFPALYNAIVDLGVAKERDRVCSHLILGDASGDMSTAMAAVRDGSEMTATISAQYQAAGMRRDFANARKADNPDVKDIKTEDQNADTYAAAVADEFKKLMGGE